MKKIAIPNTRNGGACETGESSAGSAVGTAPAELEAMLTERDVEAIAEATARKILDAMREPTRTFGLVDARELAKGLGVSPHFVYAHATELGAMRLGSGPKARVRFDLDRARRALEAQSMQLTAPGRRRRRGSASAAGFS